VKRLCILITANTVMFLGCAEEVSEAPAEETHVEETPVETTEEVHAEETVEEAHVEETHWGYEGETGPEHWAEIGYPDCAGSEQSPVDISDAPVHDADITFNYNPTALNIINNGHTIKVEYDEGSTITVEGKAYNLLQFHFHAPSEHTIDGEYYDMELHLVHQSDDGEYAVIGVMITAGKENEAYKPVWDNMPAEEGELQTISGVTVNAIDLLPEDRSYYRYDGSFTTPPCTEGVKWFVLSNPVELSEEQIDAFEAIYLGNNRPVQPMNEREFI